MSNTVVLNAPNAKKREVFIDYAKCILVFMLLMDHTQFTSDYLACWTMVGFFMITGYFYKKGKSIGPTIKKYFKGILVPFWTTILVCGLFEVFRAPYLEYGDKTTFLYALANAVWGSNVAPYTGTYEKYITMLGTHNVGTNFYELTTPTTCALWYLPALFSASVMMLVYQEKIRKKAWNDIMAIIILIVLFWAESLMPWQLPYGIGRGFFGCACMIIGKDLKEMDLFSRKKAMHVVGLGGIALYTIFYLLGWVQNAYLSYIISDYNGQGPLALLFTFFLFSCAAIGLLYLMKLLSMILPHSRLLSTIGMNTLPIYRWHLIVITLLDILFNKLFGVPLTLEYFYLALIKPEDSIFRVLSIVGAVAICLGLHYAYLNLKSRFFQKRQAA